MGKDDLEVRREDQDKINKFSRLHQRELLLEDDLKSRAVGEAMLCRFTGIAYLSPRRKRKIWMKSLTS